MRARFLVLALAQVALAAGPAAGSVYSCEVDGKVVSRDRPCTGSSPPAPTPMVTRPGQGEPAAYDDADWLFDLDGYSHARRLSRQHKVPMLIYFQADWCGYCRKLERELLHEPRAKQALRRIIKVQITPEKGPEDGALFKALGGTGYPTVLFQATHSSKPKKYLLMRKVGGTWHTKSVEELIAILEGLFPS